MGVYKNLKRFTFSLLPDKLYLTLLFRHRFGYWMDWNNPQTFNEKLQWLKLYYRKSIFTTMVDKYLVKQYISEKIGEEYVIPLLGVWNRPEDIDFNKLPNQFVLKCNHTSGVGLAICKDKNKFDIESAIRELNKGLKNNYYSFAREWPYKNVSKKIIAEKYMADKKQSSLNDYKFYCFGGKPKFLYYSSGLENHSTARITFLTLDWNRAPFQRTDYKQHETLPSKPSKFNEMVSIAEKLSVGLPFVRVDLFQINDDIYFSELTFYPCAGYMKFNPKRYDKIVGDYLNLSV